MRDSLIYSHIQITFYEPLSSIAARVNRLWPGLRPLSAECCMSLSARLLRPLAVMVALLLPAAPVLATELVMMDREGCGYCIAWKKEIGPAYPNTEAGQFAPLRIVNIRDGAPDGVRFARPVIFTPTFILIADGAELARIEGYPGEDFFWGLLEKMLKETTDFVGSS
jgi:hypothetical protein